MAWGERGGGALCNQETRRCFRSEKMELAAKQAPETWGHAQSRTAQTPPRVRKGWMDDKRRRDLAGRAPRAVSMWGLYLNYPWGRGVEGGEVRLR